MTKFCDKHHMPDCPWCYTPPTPSTEELTDEVERLKKELEKVKAERDEIAMIVGEEQFALGETEGERRAMQRVKDAIDVEFDRHTPTRPSVDCIEMESARTALSLLKARLGLGEEEKPVVFKCTCTLGQLENRQCTCEEEKK